MVEVVVDPIVSWLIGWPFLVAALNPIAAAALWLVGIAVFVYLFHYFSRHDLDGMEWCIALVWPVIYYLAVGYGIYRGVRWLTAKIVPLLDRATARLLTRTIDKTTMGSLIEQRWSKGRIRRYLIVHDETGRHAIPIPPPNSQVQNIDTVLEAIAWTFRLNEDEYAPAVEV